MRKALLVIAGLAVIMATGCGGEAPNPTVKGGGVEEIQTEEILVEEILVEDIRVEEIQVEPIKVTPIDGEYAAEVKYNSRVNTWDNGNNITRWD